MKRIILQIRISVACAAVVASTVIGAENDVQVTDLKADSDLEEAVSELHRRWPGTEAANKFHEIERQLTVYGSTNPPPPLERVEGLEAATLRDLHFLKRYLDKRIAEVEANRQRAQSSPTRTITDAAKLISEIYLGTDLILESERRLLEGHIKEQQVSLKLKKDEERRRDKDETKGQE